MTFTCINMELKSLAFAIMVILFCGYEQNDAAPLRQYGNGREHCVVLSYCQVFNGMCKNGGKCIINPNDDCYSTCLCKDGFTGDLCDTVTKKHKAKRTRGRRPKAYNMLMQLFRSLRVPEPSTNENSVNSKTQSSSKNTNTQELDKSKPETPNTGNPAQIKREDSTTRTNGQTNKMSIPTSQKSGEPESVTKAIPQTTGKPTTVTAEATTTTTVKAQVITTKATKTSSENNVNVSEENTRNSQVVTQRTTVGVVNTGATLKEAVRTTVPSIGKNKTPHQQTMDKSLVSEQENVDTAIGIPETNTQVQKSPEHTTLKSYLKLSQNEISLSGVETVTPSQLQVNTEPTTSNGLTTVNQVSSSSVSDVKLPGGIKNEKESNLPTGSPKITVQVTSANIAKDNGDTKEPKNKELKKVERGEKMPEHTSNPNIVHGTFSMDKTGNVADLKSQSQKASSTDVSTELIDTTSTVQSTDIASTTTSPTTIRQIYSISSGSVEKTEEVPLDSSSNEQNNEKQSSTSASDIPSTTPSAHSRSTVALVDAITTKSSEKTIQISKQMSENDKKPELNTSFKSEITKQTAAEPKSIDMNDMNNKAIEAKASETVVNPPNNVDVNPKPLTKDNETSEQTGNNRDKSKTARNLFDSLAKEIHLVPSESRTSATSAPGKSKAESTIIVAKSNIGRQSVSAPMEELGNTKHVGDVDQSPSETVDEQDASNIQTSNSFKPTTEHPASSSVSSENLETQSLNRMLSSTEDTSQSSDATTPSITTETPHTRKESSDASTTIVSSNIKITPVPNASNNDRGQTTDSNTENLSVETGIEAGITTVSGKDIKEESTNPSTAAPAKNFVAAGSNEIIKESYAEDKTTVSLQNNDANIQTMIGEGVSPEVLTETIESSTTIGLVETKDQNSLSKAEG